MQRKKIVLDKCYLKGVRTTDLVRLSGEYEFIIIDMLFYEIESTTDANDRLGLLQKLQSIASHCSYAPNFGYFMDYELKHCRPAKKLTLHSETKELKEFLLRGEFDLDESQFAFLQRVKEKRETRDVVREIESWKQILEEVIIEPGSLKKGAELSEVEDVFKPFGQDSEKIRRLAWNVLRDLGVNVSSRKVTPEWSIYRYLQYDVFVLIDFYRRYGMGQEKVNLKKIVNTVFDLSYGIFGSLFDGLATSDRDLIFFFKLATPDKVTITLQ